MRKISFDYSNALSFINENENDFVPFYKECSSNAP